MYNRKSINHEHNHPTVWRTNVTGSGACTNSRPSKTAKRVRKSACFFAWRPQEHLRRIPLFPWTAARIWGIQIWRWPQPEVTLETTSTYCKINIVTHFSFFYLLIYFISSYFIYLFILHSRHLKIFCVFFRALGEPLDQDSVPVGQSLKYTSINQSIIELNFISGCQARHALRRGDEGFIAWVSEASRTSDNDWSQLNIQVEGHHRREMNNLLRNFGGSFPKELPRNLLPKRTVNHEIDLEPGYSPPSKPPYRLFQPHLDELQTQWSALLEHGFIEPSKSPFGAPVFLVRKSDGSLRLVCDWRELNCLTIKNSWHHSWWSHLAKRRILSCIDNYQRLPYQERGLPA